MVTKIEIMKTAIVPIFGEKAFNDEFLRNLIEEEAEEIIDLELEVIDEGPWRTLQHNDESLPHGFIYYSCNMEKLQDLLHAIEVHQMLEANPLKI